MAEYQAGFIGCGNMGSVLAAAAAKSGARIAAADHHPEKTEALVRKCGAAALDSAGAVAENSAFLFLGVKPQAMPALADEIRAVLDRRSGLPGRSGRFVLVSMAAGVSMEAVARRFGGPVGTPDNCPIIRIMPNTPAAVGEGVILYCASGAVTGTEEAAFRDLLQEAGQVVKIDEGKMDAASAVTGCGPAFACLFVEGMIDGAVRCGLPRAMAEKFVLQTVLGTAKLALETEQDPALLRGAVCSPAGSTIAGVAALEERSVRFAAMEAVRAAWERTRELGA